MFYELFILFFTSISISSWLLLCTKRKKNKFLHVFTRKNQMLDDRNPNSNNDAKWQNPRRDELIEMYKMQSKDTSKSCDSKRGVSDKSCSKRERSKRKFRADDMQNASTSAVSTDEISNSMRRRNATLIRSKEMPLCEKHHSTSHRKSRKRKREKSRRTTPLHMVYKDLEKRLKEIKNEENEAGSQEMSEKFKRSIRNSLKESNQIRKSKCSRSGNSESRGISLMKTQQSEGEKSESSRKLKSERGLRRNRSKPPESSKRMEKKRSVSTPKNWDSMNIDTERSLRRRKASKRLRRSRSVSLKDLSLKEADQKTESSRRHQSRYGKHYTSSDSKRRFKEKTVFNESAKDRSEKKQRRPLDENGDIRYGSKVSGEADSSQLDVEPSLTKQERLEKELEAQLANLALADIYTAKKWETSGQKEERRRITDDADMKKIKGKESAELPVEVLINEVESEEGMKNKKNQVGIKDVVTQSSKASLSPLKLTAKEHYPHTIKEDFKKQMAHPSVDDITQTSHLRDLNDTYKESIPKKKKAEHLKQDDLKHKIHLDEKRLLEKDVKKVITPGLKIRRKKNATNGENSKAESKSGPDNTSKKKGKRRKVKRIMRKEPNEQNGNLVKASSELSEKKEPFNESSNMRSSISSISKLSEKDLSKSQSSKKIKKRKKLTDEKSQKTVSGTNTDDSNKDLTSSKKTKRRKKGKKMKRKKELGKKVKLTDSSKSLSTKKDENEKGKKEKYDERSDNWMKDHSYSTKSNKSKRNEDDKSQKKIKNEEIKKKKKEDKEVSKKEKQTEEKELKKKEGEEELRKEKKLKKKRQDKESKSKKKNEEDSKKKMKKENKNSLKKKDKKDESESKKERKKEGGLKSEKNSTSREEKKTKDALKKKEKRDDESQKKEKKMKDDESRKEEKEKEGLRKKIKGEDESKKEKGKEKNKKEDYQSKKEDKEGNENSVSESKKKKKDHEYEEEKANTEKEQHNTKYKKLVRFSVKLRNPESELNINGR